MIKNQIPNNSLAKQQKKLALILFETGIIQFNFKKGWRLKLHEKHPRAPLSPFYINLRLLQSCLPAKKEALNALVQLAKPLKYDSIAGIPLAAISLASSMADKTGKPQITPRINKKSHGQSQQIDGIFQKNDVVLLIDDLVTRADSKLEVIKILENNDLIVKDLIVLFDREQGGKEQLSQKGYQLHSALKITPVLNFYEKAGKISSRSLKKVLNYLATFSNKT